MRTKSHGFTLIELIVAITVLGILIGIGVPSFQNMIMDNRMTSEVNDLVASLNQARSEAVKQNTSVVLCRTDNGTSCANAGTNWESGWIVFVDRNGDALIDDGDACGQNATDDCILTVQNAPSGNIDITASGTVQDAITYRGDGSSLGDAGGATPATFTFCDDRGADEARAVIISPTGRPGTSGTKNDGSALTCA